MILQRNDLMFKDFNLLFANKILSFCLYFQIYSLKKFHCPTSFTDPPNPLLPLPTPAGTFSYFLQLILRIIIDWVTTTHPNPEFQLPLRPPVPASHPFSLVLRLV
jgi:hypothetical protein